MKKSNISGKVLSGLKKTAVSCAVEAGEYALKRKGRIKDITYKGEINLVTDVDKACENIIISNIKKKYPGHCILSEEDDVKDDTVSDFKWIIDPLDGTTNYSRSLPIYCVSIGVEYKGRVVAGCVYDPEKKELFHAAYKKGAFLNRRRIYVSKTKNLKSSFLVTGFAYNVHTSSLDNVEYFKSFIKRCLAVRRLGAAALDLSYVACGRFDGFWEMKLYPWDAAAGVLLVNEAGGKVTKFDGRKHSHYDKEILSSNSAIHSKMVSVIKSTKLD